MAIAKELHPAFWHREYLFHRGLFSLFSGAVHDGNGNRIFNFRIKHLGEMGTDFRVYSDGVREEEFLTIKSSKLIEIDGTYAVHDTTTDKAVGTISRKNIKSIVKDEWVFLSNEGEEIGRLTERNVSGALFGRFFGYIPVIGDIAPIPKRFVIVSATGTEVAQIRQQFAPLARKYSMTMVELEPSIDRRLLIAAGVLLAGN